VAAVVGLTLAAIGLGGSAGARAGALDPPLRLRLTAGRTTYQLVDGGKRLRKKLDDFRREQAKDGAGPPVNRRLEPLAVDLTLRISNVTTEDVTFRNYGDERTDFSFELKGPGVVVLTPAPIHTLELCMSPPTRLAPGHAKRVRLTQLTYGFRGAQHAYWTVPGRYTLRAIFDTAIKPRPLGASADHEGFGEITLTSNPVTIDVR